MLIKALQINEANYTSQSMVLGQLVVELGKKIILLDMYLLSYPNIKSKCNNELNTHVLTKNNPKLYKRI